MAMITDEAYVIHAIRLTSLRNTDDPVTARILTLDPDFAVNPYINAAGLSDIDHWPEISRALDSPPLDPGFASWEDARQRDRKRGAVRGEDGGGGGGGGSGGAGGLRYTQTIMGPGRSGGMGMRVSGRRLSRDGTGSRTQGKGPGAGTQISPIIETTPTTAHQPTLDDGFFSPPAGRPRAGSAPGAAGLPGSLGGQGETAQAGPSSLLETGHGLGANAVLDVAPLQQAAASSLTSTEYDIASEDKYAGELSLSATGGVEGSSTGGVGVSAQRSELRMTISDDRILLADEMIDEGSDVEEEDMEDEGIRLGPESQPPDRRRSRYEPAHHASDQSPRSSRHFSFGPRSTIEASTQPQMSALTAQLNRHVPHLVSTAEPSADPPKSSIVNPFASLYSSVSAPSSLPGLEMELYFPHSSQPGSPINVKVRKDASVEEVTGLGLCRYWEENRQPKLLDMDEDERDVRWTTVGWGLRIVEDDGEVDEDFPPLDRDSQVSKFSYGQFAIVEATESQVRQNAAKAPHIVRRPSRVITAARAGNNGSIASSSRPKLPVAAGPSPDPFMNESIVGSVAGTTLKGSVGLSSALSRPVLLRVKVTVNADVHFTTTISVPSDMYIADLTEILCKRKRLAMPATDWVLCLADLSLALPLDRTVASLGGKTDLALVRRRWAVERGLRTDDRRGGDPSASIFKRMSEPPSVTPAVSGFADFAQSYKKFHVTRRMAIGRHERVLAIDGDYIHIMPSEQRAFFDSTKTTSFHITLIASCKLSGNNGGFKLLVWRDGGQKRYDFEAKNVKQAAEIITSIRQVMRTYQAERSSLLPPPRPAARTSQK